MGLKFKGFNKIKIDKNMMSDVCTFQCTNSGLILHTYFYSFQTSFMGGTHCGRRLTSLAESCHSYIDCRGRLT